MKKFLTVAYLITAFVITAATSKMPDKSNRPTEVIKYARKEPFSEITNYSVESTCSVKPDTAAIRVKDGAIIEVLTSDGTLVKNPDLKFTDLGFPHNGVVIGLDQDDTTNADGKKCAVRERKQEPFPEYEHSPRDSWFVEPGFLTTTVYDCHEKDKPVCSITFKELPGGDLKTVAQKTAEHTDN